MRRWSPWACLAGVVVLVLASAVPTAAVSGDWQARMLAKVNAVRASAGVPPVALCAPLTSSAQGYAEAMARTGRFGHTAVDGRDAASRVAQQGYTASVVGENLGAGQGTVVQVMRAWRASPPHYATMTDPRLRHVGFGFAPGTGTTYRSYWVQEYAAGGRCG